MKATKAEILEQFEKLKNAMKEFSAFFDVNTEECQALGISVTSAVTIDKEGDPNSAMCNGLVLGKGRDLFHGFKNLLGHAPESLMIFRDAIENSMDDAIRGFLNEDHVGSEDKVGSDASVGAANEG